MAESTAPGLDPGFLGRPDFEILPAVSGRGMDEACAGVVGDVLAGQQRHVEPVAAQAGIAQRMGAGRRRQIVRVDRPPLLEPVDPCRAHDVGGEGVGQNQPVAGLRPVAVGRGRYLVQAVGQAAGIAERPVAGDRPRRRRPDDDRGADEIAGPANHRKFRPDGVGLMVEILDFRLGERRALDDRPHDRFRAAVEHSVGGELHQLGRDQRLGVELSLSR